MSIKEELLEEIEDAPEPLLSEVLDFVQFLKSKIHREKMEVMLMGEAAFARDWLSPEEDEAWRDL